MAPDGGWGWMITFGGFMMTTIVGGVQTSYGVFYIEVLDRFNYGYALSAWLGGMQSFFRLSLSPFASALCNRFSVQSVTIAGGVLYGFGYFLSAFAESLGVLYVTYGLMMGLGGALVYTPSFIIVSEYFDKHRGVALSLMSCGAGIGSFVWPPTFHFMLKELSYFETMSISAGLSFNLIVTGALFYPLPPDTHDCEEVRIMNDVKVEDDNCQFDQTVVQKQNWKKNFYTAICEKYFNISVFTDLNVVLFYSAVIFYMLGAFSYVNLIVDFAKERGVALDSAAFLLSFEGISQFMTRFLSGFLFDHEKVRPKRVIIWSAAYFIISLSVFIAVLCHSFASFAIVTVVFACCKGLIISQLVSVLGDITPKEKLPAAIGFAGLARSIGILIGSVLSGYLKDVTQSYTVSYIVMGAIVMIACVFLLILNLRLRHSETLETT